MPTIVCGKRSFCEPPDSAASLPICASPPACKKPRCNSSSSPVRFTSRQTSPLDQLKALYPDTEIQLLEKALEESGGDLDLATKNLHKLCLGYCNRSSSSTTEEYIVMGKVAEAEPAGEDAMHLHLPQIPNILPVHGAQWVDLLVTEMCSATNIGDARSRVANVLESLEKSISARVSAEAAQSLHKENVMLKEQREQLLRDNTILKRAVAIQHEHQKENEQKKQEAQQLKQLVSQYQEQLRTLEVNNYALMLHLRQAYPGSSIPGHFNPDVF